MLVLEDMVFMYMVTGAHLPQDIGGNHAYHGLSQHTCQHNYPSCLPTHWRHLALHTGVLYWMPHLKTSAGHRVRQAAPFMTYRQPVAAVGVGGVS